MKWPKFSASNKEISRFKIPDLNPFKSIRFPFLVIMAIAILGTSFAIYHVHRHSLKESLFSEAEKRAHNNMGLLQNHLTNHLDSLLIHGRNLASRYNIELELHRLRGNSAPANHNELWQQLLTQGDYELGHDNVLLLDSQGQAIFNRGTRPQFPTTDIKLASVFEGGELKDIVPADGSWLLRAAVPLRLKNNAQGALILTMDLNLILEDFSTTNQTNQILADINGVLASGGSSQAPIEIDQTKVEHILAQGSMQTDINLRRKSLTHYMPIQFDGEVFVLVTGISLEQILLSLEQKRQEVLQATLLVLAVLLPLSAWCVRLLLRPLVILRKRVAEVTEQLAGTSFEGSQGHAINRLISTFDGMALALQHHEEARQKAEALLQQEHASLEVKVKDRTLKLEQANDLLLREISERTRAQQKAEDLQKLFASLIDAMPSLLIGIDHDGRINQWNLEAQKTCGLSFAQVKGRPFGESLPWMLSIKDKIDQTLSRGVRNKISHFHWAPGTSERLVDIVINPLSSTLYSGAVIRIDDVTERVRLDELIMQTEKMMSVGGLAAGMAHEINNPLAGIIQNTQVISQRLSPELNKNRGCAEQLGLDLETVNRYMLERQIPNMLTSILASGQRIGEIVTNMASFSRENDVMQAKQEDVELLDVAALLDLSVELTTKDYDLKKKHNIGQIKINRNYAANLPKVQCTPDQLKQVFFNLIQNAAQAISSWDAMKNRPQIDLLIQQEEQMLSVEISDNGPGIEFEIQKRIFEPFFTTKDVGLGTGLGLSVSYFIITENHQGQLSVRSRPGQGTCFKILLPLQT